MEGNAVIGAETRRVEEHASTTLRLPRDLWEAVKAQAEREGISANAFVLSAIHSRLHGDPIEVVRRQFADLEQRLALLQDRLAELERESRE